MQKYENILKFNTKGVKNFSDLTIIKSRKRKTAQMIIEMTTKDETRGNDLSEQESMLHFVDIHQLFWIIPCSDTSKKTLQCYSVTQPHNHNKVFR